MFVVIREWGEYSEHGARCICICNSNEDAKKAIDLLKKVDQFSISESKKLKSAIKEYENSLGIKTYPLPLKKSIIDPKNIISQNDWLKYYIEPHKKLYTEVYDYNFRLQNKINQFAKDWKYTIPDELMQFKDEIDVSIYSDYRSEYTYSIEEIPVISF